MRSGFFTVGALDNLDHNPSSSTAKGSFHGTAISLFLFPTAENEGIKQTDIRLSSVDAKKNNTLPDSYTIVPAVALKTTIVSVPKLVNTSVSKEGQLANAQLQEKEWLKHASQLLDCSDTEAYHTIAWSAYHASMQNLPSGACTTLTQLLPLFYDKAAIAAMIKHGIDVLRKATQFLNPGQTPVMAFDAPLFALAKFVQWKWPETHGEDKFIAMFGGLHIEMAVWKTFGDYLEESGWTTALVQGGIATTRTAESFLKVSHLL